MIGEKAPGVKSPDDRGEGLIGEEVPGVKASHTRRLGTRCAIVNSATRQQRSAPFLLQCPAESSRPAGSRM